MDTVIKKKTQHPKDPDYFKIYYQNNNKGVMIQCPRCHCQTSKVNISKHMKRDICLKKYVSEVTLLIMAKIGISPDPNQPDKINLKTINDLNAEEI